MFKLVVLSVFLAVAAAAPSAPLTYAYASEPLVHAYSPIHAVGKHAVYSPAHTVVEVQPEIHLAKVGAIVEHVPTAVSHQSQTVVHSKAAVVTPVVAAYSAPVASVSYHAAPIHYTHGPVAKTIVAHGHHGHLAYSAPLVHSW